MLPNAESSVTGGAHVVPERLLAVWGQEDRGDVSGNRHMSFDLRAFQFSNFSISCPPLIFLLAIK